MTPKQAALLTLALPALTAGCRPRQTQQQNTPSVLTQELAIKTINHYYETEPSCLWFEPVTLPTIISPDKQTLSQMEALAQSGLLARTITRTGPRFALAPPGKPFFRPDVNRAGYGNICYGNPHAQNIEAIARRNDPTFGEVTDVNYTAALAQAPAWTSAPPIQSAFPKVKLEISQPLPEIATLKQTANGWSVAVGPANALSTAVSHKDTSAP